MNGGGEGSLPRAKKQPTGLFFCTLRSAALFDAPLAERNAFRFAWGEREGGGYAPLAFNLLHQKQATPKGGFVFGNLVVMLKLILFKGNWHRPYTSS